jgi:hypothetical protein
MLHLNFQEPQAERRRAKGEGHRAQGTEHRAQGTGHRAQGAGRRDYVWQQMATFVATIYCKFTPNSVRSVRTELPGV